MAHQTRNALPLERCPATGLESCPASARGQRRDCVRHAGAALALALLPARLSPALRLLLPAVSGHEAWQSRPRALWVTRPQAQEAVRTVYWADAGLQPDGYAALERIYRDVRAGVQHPIALGLLDLNFALQCAVHALYGLRPMVLFSGYRTPGTNRMVGGSEPSVHATGQADDFVYEGLSLLENFRLARYFQVGGLGLYPERGSLHKDVAEHRSWITRGR